MCISSGRANYLIAKRAADSCYFLLETCELTHGCQLNSPILTLTKNNMITILAWYNSRVCEAVFLFAAKVSFRKSHSWGQADMLISDTASSWSFCSHSLSDTPMAQWFLNVSRQNESRRKPLAYINPTDAFVCSSLRLMHTHTHTHCRNEDLKFLCRAVSHACRRSWVRHVATSYG